ASLAVTAQLFCPAQLNRAHHTPFVAAKMPGMHLTLGLAAAAEDVCHLQSSRHGEDSGRWHHLQPQPIEWARRLPDERGRNLRVARRARQVVMAEQDLDDPDVGAVLQKMSGEAVPERMHRHTLAETRCNAGRATGRVENLN